MLVRVDVTKYEHGLHENFPTIILFTVSPPPPFLSPSCSLVRSLTSHTQTQLAGNDRFFLP